MPPRLAILDLGTNTFHLLIAERTNPGPTILHKGRVAVKLGLGGINHDRITPEAEGRAMEALASFGRTLAEFSVSEVQAFGTSALRNASNGRALADRIRRELGFTIDIIDGNREAELILAGVSSAVNFRSQVSLVMDIGGGSVEFIIGMNNRIHWKLSLEIGGQRLLERFHHHDPIAAGERKALEEYLAEALQPLWRALATHQPSTLIGASGTFDTLSEIFCLQNHIQPDPNATETPLSVEGFYKIFSDLVVQTREKRMAVPGMIEMRVDMIVVTCCLIKAILDRHPFREVRVSAYSLKEGALYSHLEIKYSK